VSDHSQKTKGRGKKKEEGEDGERKGRERETVSPGKRGKSRILTDTSERK
jgi:hypothetical protein